MKQIVLLSDTHHTLDERFFSHFENADEIWHAGDIGSLDVTDHLKNFAPVRAVFGNIDNHKIRAHFKKTLLFRCEDVKVMMTHIGGYPNRYAKGIKERLEEIQADLFICGHSHILKVMYDKKIKTMHMNPGAIGDFGIHQVKTILCFTIDGKDIKALKVVEFPKRKI
jgi:putative phosphoesterase